MKRSIKQLASFAAIGALSLSASICVAAGETGISTYSADSMTTWYGNAGGPVPPVSLTTQASRGGKVRSASVDSLKDFYGNAGGPVGVAAITGFKPGKVAGVSGSQNTGCQGFGRAGGPVGPEAIRCGGTKSSAVATAEVR
jgi:hypothetical protein